jgi:hypothetical protein
MTSFSCLLRVVASQVLISLRVALTFDFIVSFAHLRMYIRACNVPPEEQFFEIQNFYTQEMAVRRSK